METVIIEPKPPYNIKLHWESYTFEQPQPHIYENGMWQRALRLGNGKLVPVEVEPNDDVEKPQLKLDFLTNLTEVEEKEAIEKVKWIFNTEYDLRPLYGFMSSDPVLRDVGSCQYGLKPGYISTVYEGIITAIIQQQISLKIASRMARQVIQKLGECIQVDGKDFWEFPSPHRLAQARVEDLRGCGLSSRKAEYIIDFSNSVARNEFDTESLKTCEHEEIIERMTRIRGLGRWSAEMTIVTAIGVDNISPAGDLGARKAVSHFYNHDKLMSENEAREVVDKWGVYKGIITYYLIAEYSCSKQ